MSGLFASWLNQQIDEYVSWQPDRYSLAIDACTISWINITFYAYQPFSMVGATLSKIIKNKSTRIMTIPDWPNQYWYTIMMDLLIANPVTLPHFQTVITQPFNPTARPPLFPKMKLLATLLSGDTSLTASFQIKLKKLSWNHGEVERGKKMVYGHL